jgi:hypothetical protein
MARFLSPLYILSSPSAIILGLRMIQSNPIQNYDQIV